MSKLKMTLQAFLPWLLTVGGAIGLICSYIITADKMKLLEDASFRPGCDLNPVISCGSVMQSAQSHIFGFSNSFIGLVSFAILIAIGMALFAGATFKRWYWLGLQIGCALGFIFVHWLLVQSLYYIHALCPYCMVVWIVTITTFWYVLLYNIQHRHIVLRGAAERAGWFCRRHHLDILLFWFLILFVLIMCKFWYYYGPILGF